tara:strand:+ start:14638 stop:16731 length:2094 start_codon:yes stop_codon:yes gene_type:complete
MVSNKNKILVTSALPYANGSLHLGHMVEYVQTDVFVRFLKMSGTEVVFVCADDSHGAPIEIASSKAGIKPEELIEKYGKEHITDFNDFLIDFDVYHTTHSKENKTYSDFFYNTLKKKGFIHEKLIEQTYCEKDKRFLPDRFVRGTCPKCKATEQYGDQCEKCNSVYKPIDLIEPKCSICGAAPIRKTSSHYFFTLSKFSDKLKDWITKNKNLQPEIKNFVMGWIKSGLEDWDITRDGPYFGFKIPEQLNKYYYVWLDAPIGYVSASEKYAKDKLKKDASIFWQSKDSEIIHFIGKDIIYFHLLFWPAMLMGVGYNLPKDVVVHGFLTINGEKMSKSRGTFFTAREYLDKYDPELLRFYYASNLAKTTSDIDLDFKDFQSKVNNELVSNISNFIYRSLNFINKNFDSKLGKISKTNEDTILAATLQSKFNDILKSYAAYNFRDAVKVILEISSEGNKYLQDNEPWKLLKEDKKKCHEILTFSANIVKNLAILLYPVLPNFSVKIQKQLGLNKLTFNDLNFGLANCKINMGRIIFTNIEETPQLGSELFLANLKIAVVDSVENHPNADKLYVLKIKIGNEGRTLVAGLKEFYSKEELKGKQVVVVTNLKHAKLRGIESQGMLLTAEKNSKPMLLAAPKASSGDSVFAEGLESSTQEVDIEKFYSLGLSVEGKRIFYGERILKTEKSDVVVDADDRAKIK